MTMLYIRAFRPLTPTVNVAVTAASQAVQINRPNIGTQSIRIHNVGGAVTFVEIGKTNATVASATTSFPILPNTYETFTILNDESWVAVVGTVANTGYITTGESA
jgi:hypothetical protein